MNPNHELRLPAPAPASARLFVPLLFAWPPEIGINGYLHGTNKQQSFKCVGSWNPNMKIYEHILANLNGHKLSRSQFRRNKLFIYVIFLLQYEMWQQDGLINMEAGQTKLRFPKRSVVFQRLIFSSHLQLERCWILNPKAQQIKRMEQFLKSSKWHPAELNMLNSDALICFFTTLHT